MASSPSSSLSPPPPNATSDPPASSNTPPPPPLPSTSPPPSSVPPPPLISNSPPPSTSPPPSSAPPPTSSAPPPTPILTPPPPSPPQADPPSTPTLPPPTPPTSSPLPTSSPPIIITPPSPPPPSANPPAPSPPSPISESPPPPKSRPPPSNPSTSPPKEQPPSIPSSPSPPNNSSSNATPVDPSLPSPPLQSPNTPSGGLTPPISPSGDGSSSFGPNVTARSGDGSNSGGGGAKTGVAVPVVVVTSLVVLGLVGLAVWYFRKKKRRSGGYAAGFVMPSPFSSSQMSESSYAHTPTAPLVYNSSGPGNHGFLNSPDPALGNSKQWFSYKELYKITNGFSDENLLGEGGFGCVYKGCLSDGREVAVKQLKVGGSQGEREFRAEVEIIGRVHHRHLVSLVGYCIADSQRMLVYDYVPNNTLDYHLHAKGIPVLDWTTRVKVAAGAARGLAYLHEDCHPRIIHRDIKSSNILLDSNFEAQVADFGLARLAMDAATHVTTRVMGTFGYLAPEYASSGKLTERSDVYSFGVVLLELITGRKPVDTTQPVGDESLVEWARPLLSHALETGDFNELPDPRLENSYNEREMFQMIETSAACVRHSASMRPRMGLVVRALDLADIDLSNGMRPGQSELFSAQSAEIRLFQRMAFGSQDYSSDFSNFSNFSRTSRQTQRDS